MIKLNANNNVNTTTIGGVNVIVAQTEANFGRMLNYVYEGVTAAKKVNNMDLIVEADKIVNKQKTFIVLSYAAGSDVGVTTKGANLGTSLYSHSEQFFNVNGKLELRKIRKVLKFFGSNADASGSGVRYKSVFVEGVNKQIAVDKHNRASVLVRVSVWEIKKFANRIRGLDFNITTAEDLKAIALDLDAICRALQELSIDVAKDASKDIGINIHKLINCKSNALSDIIKKGTVINNMTEGINLMMQENNLKGFKYEMKASGFKLLKDVDANDNNELAAAIVEDYVGEAQEAINVGLTKSMNELVNLLGSCNGQKYDQYKSYISMAKNPVTDEAIIANHLIKTILAASNTLSTMFAAKVEDMKVSSNEINEFCIEARNAIYTEAASFGITPSEVVKMAIASTFCYMTEEGKIYESKSASSMYAVKMIFPKEFIIEYIADGASNPAEAITTCLELVRTSVDLYVDQELSFDEGIAITDDGGIVKVRESYTGKAVVTVDGDIVVKDHDFYAYEKVGYIVTQNTCVDNVVDMTNSQLVIPEPIKSTDDVDRFNEVLTNAVIGCDGYVVIPNTDYVAVKNGNNITVIGQAIATAKAGKAKAIGAITRKGGFICFR